MSEDQRATVESTLHSANGKGVVRMRARFESGIDDVWSALSEPEHLARWFGHVTGDLRDDGEYSAVVFASGWDGRGRIDACVQPQRLTVTMWEQEGAEHTIAVELSADGNHTILALEVRGVPLEYVWAYGAGWQEHVEDLGLHLAGRDRPESPSGTGARFEELEPLYRAMAVAPLEL
jgi:uncharacterized protein YndB with AHSA1/START domain